MITKFVANYSPRAIILLILITYFIPNFSSIDRIGNQWLYLSIINLIGIFVIYFKYNGDLKLFYFKKVYALRWYLLFIITGFMSILVSNNINESIIIINQFLNCFLAFYLIFYFLSEIESREDFVIETLFVLLLFEIYFSFSPILKDISSDSLVFRSMKYSGLAANINITSFSLVFKLPILLYLITKVKIKLKKTLLSILLTILLYITFILGTRGALLGLIICFGVYFFFIIINYKTIKKQLSGLFLIAFSVILSVTFNLNTNFKGSGDSVIERASTISISTTDGSVNQRLRYYKHGLSQFLETPFLGVGVGNWKFKSIGYDKNDILQYTVPYHAHNDFIQILAEQGVFGFLCYVMVFLTSFFVLLKKKLISMNSPYIFLMGSFLIFFLDSNLNFPIARPISQLQFILIIALISTNQKD